MSTTSGTPQETEQMSADIDFTEYPSIDVAYERIGEWYEAPQKRLDVIEEG